MFKNALLVAFLLSCAVASAQTSIGPPAGSQIKGVSGNGNGLVTTTGTNTAGDGGVWDANGNWVDSGSVAGSGSPGTNNENLTFSATPTFSTTYTSSRIALSGNITAFSLGSGSDGQNKCINFAHDSSSTAYTVNPPANVHGFFSVGATPSKNSVQCFTYFVSDAAWIATSPGVINE